MKTENKIITGLNTHCPVSLLAVAMIGMAMPLWGQGPTLEIARSVLLTWPATEPGYIVVQSRSSEGPWVPSLEPISQVLSENRVAVPIRKDAQFFKLAQGGQLLEDFSSGTNRPWTLQPQSGNEADFETSYPNGGFRIQELVADVGAAMLNPPMWPIDNWPQGADVAISVDVLDWDENATSATIGFGARFVRPSLNGYWPRLDLHGNGNAGFWNGEAADGAWREVVDSNSFWLGPKRPLRLIYTLAGREHTTAIFDLAVLSAKPSSPPFSVSKGFDNCYTEGQFGLWFAGGITSTPFEITFDNIVMTWTQP